ncbi:MAG TPA: NAD(P)/FAD-dependent oxidoreductase [Gammaproteobacteria bacterium]|nr:NAD(P)/FAD-dependent oxidoreductase [Gammaproteobacteria bacterium]
MDRITVVGNGFAALSAVDRLRRREAGLEVVLVAPEPVLMDYPGRVRVPCGLRASKEVRVPLDGFLRRRRVRYQRARLTGLRRAGRLVLTDRGEIRADGLVSACGARFVENLPGIEHSISLADGGAAARARPDRIDLLEQGALAFADNPLDHRASRGAPLLEVLFSVDTLLRRQGRRHRFALRLFSPAPTPARQLGPRAARLVSDEMQRRGIRRHLGEAPLRFDPGHVVTERGRTGADLICFMPGLAGPEWLAASGLSASPAGFLEADEFRRARTTGRVYVAGSCGGYPGPAWRSRDLRQSELQARAAADNPLSELRTGRPGEPFRIRTSFTIDTLDAGILVYRTPRRDRAVRGGRPPALAQAPARMASRARLPRRDAPGPGARPRPKRCGTPVREAQCCCRIS